MKKPAGTNNKQQPRDPGGREVTINRYCEQVNRVSGWDTGGEMEQQMTNHVTPIKMLVNGVVVARTAITLRNIPADQDPGEAFKRIANRVAAIAPSLTVGLAYENMCVQLAGSSSQYIGAGDTRPEPYFQNNLIQIAHLVAVELVEQWSNKPRDKKPDDKKPQDKKVRDHSSFMELIVDDRIVAKTLVELKNVPTDDNTTDVFDAIAAGAAARLADWLKVRKISDVIYVKRLGIAYTGACASLMEKAGKMGFNIWHGNDIVDLCHGAAIDLFDKAFCQGQAKSEPDKYERAARYAEKRLEAEKAQPTERDQIASDILAGAIAFLERTCRYRGVSVWTDVKDGEDEFRSVDVLLVRGSCWQVFSMHLEKCPCGGDLSFVEVSIAADPAKREQSIKDLVDRFCADATAKGS